MDVRRRERLKAQARIAKALAHPARLYIVEELGRGPRNPSELQAQIGSSAPTLSRHLAVLREAGLIRDERRGTQIYYHLRAPCALNFFRCLESIQAANLREQASLVAHLDAP